MAKFGEMNAALKRLFTGRGREHGVAVAWQMGGQNGARQTVMRHDGKAMRLRLGERGIRHHRTDGRCREIDPLEAQRGMIPLETIGKTAIAIFTPHFKRRGPEMAARSNRC